MVSCSLLSRQVENLATRWLLLWSCHLQLELIGNIAGRDIVCYICVRIGRKMGMLETTTGECRKATKIKNKAGKAYELGWVLPFRLVCFAPRVPLLGTLVASLLLADFPPPYLYLRQLLAGRPTAESTAKACQSTYPRLRIQAKKYIERSSWGRGLEALLLSVHTICSSTASSSQGSPPWQGSENLGSDVKYSEVTRRC